MSCKKCVFIPQGIAEKNGVTTITLEDGVLGALCDNEIYYISLSISIPNTARCNRIIVTDGTISDVVAKNNQYYRDEKLPCDKLMVLCKKKDPDLSVFCRYTSDNRGCR